MQTSCGWGVPKMALEEERKALLKYHENARAPKPGDDMAERKQVSIDGLPVRTSAGSGSRSGTGHVAA